MAINVDCEWNIELWVINMAKRKVKKSVKKVAKKKPARKTFKGTISPAHCVVKHRSGICETYDERKVYGSVYAACWIF